MNSRAVGLVVVDVDHDSFEEIASARAQVSTHRFSNFLRLRTQQ